MSVNTKEFMAAFDDYIEIVETSYSDAFKSMALDMFKDIMKLTPVDEGRLRGNWQIGLGSAPTNEISRTDKSGSKAIAAASANIDQFQGGEMYLVNNMPYAEVAEYGLWGTGESSTSKTTKEGYSTQAPKGMVRITLSDFERRLKKAAQDNKV